MIRKKLSGRFKRLLRTVSFIYTNFTGKQIFVEGGQVSSIWPGYDLSMGYSKEGVAETPESCFYSQGWENQWALFDIATSVVKEVQIMSIGM